MKKRLLQRVFLVLALFSFSFPTVLLAREKPNIVVVITDDQGMGDLGCMGNPYIKTPHIDNFYSNAVRFTNYHVGTTCAPTRAAIMTGRHPNRVNAYHTKSTPGEAFI